MYIYNCLIYTIYLMWIFFYITSLIKGTNTTNVIFQNIYKNKFIYTYFPHNTITLIYSMEKTIEYINFFGKMF